MKPNPGRAPESRKRIFIAFSLFILLFGALASLLAASIVGSVARDQLAKQLMDESELVIERMETQGVQETFSGLVMRARVTYIRSDGTVLFDSQASASLENHLDRPEVQQALAKGAGRSTRYSQTMRTQTVYVATRLPDGSVLRLSAPERIADSVVAGFTPFLIFGIILLVLLSMPMANYISIRLLRPILAIDLEHPEEAAVFDEMLPLVRRIGAQNRQNRAQMEALDARRQELDTLLGGMHEGFIALGPAEEIILINTSACCHAGRFRGTGTWPPPAGNQPERFGVQPPGRAQGERERGGEADKRRPQFLSVCQHAAEPPRRSTSVQRPDRAA